MRKIIKTDTSLGELFEIQELKRIILEKEKLLVVILEKVERLKIKLSAIKQEYDIKIGRLYLRLDEIDLEILKFKKIEDLLLDGFSLSEAQKIVNEKIKHWQERIRGEYEKIDDEEKSINNHKVLFEKNQEEINRIWRKLAHKYHPDLTNGNEEIMKKINKAYAEHDLEALRAIDCEQIRSDLSLTDIETLKIKLVNIEMAMDKAVNELNVLQRSEWNILKENMEKSIKQKRDLLGDLEDKILIEIARKETQLTDLKNKYGQG
jgi:hypothetical protein